MSNKTVVIPDMFADLETVVCDGEIVWMPKPPDCERDPEHIRRDTVANLLVTSPPTEAQH